MFKESNPQRPLFGARGLMTPEKQAQCEKSWAGPFRSKALPILLKHENKFSDLFDADNGRPNRPVALVAGTLILKEMFDLTDQEALEHLDFDMRWMYAFDLEPDEVHLCQKTLHNFRKGLMKHGKDQVLFRTLTDELIQALGIGVKRQRIDSTHIVSNIRDLSRLGVFCETMRVFLEALQNKAPKLHEEVGAGILKRYEQESGYRYADARKAERPRRLSVAARDVYRLLKKFGQDEAVAPMEEFKLLQRLFQEQVRVVEKPQEPKDDEDDHGDGAVPVVLKEAKEVGSDSLQTPHDPEVTYSGHKGKGYEMHVTETCVAENPVNLITRVAVNRSCDSDYKATTPALQELQERKILPEEAVMDTTCGGGPNAARASGMGVDLVCPAHGECKPKDKEGTTYPKPADKCPTDPKEAGKWLTAREAQPEFRERYGIRAGIEATNSELHRGHGTKKLRVRGALRVKLAIFLKAAACNLKRALRYWLRTGADGPGVIASAAR